MNGAIITEKIEILNLIESSVSSSSLIFEAKLNLSAILFNYISVINPTTI
jgi:hypothetical protein